MHMPGLYLMMGSHTFPRASCMSQFMLLRLREFSEKCVHRQPMMSRRDVALLGGASLGQRYDSIKQDTCNLPINCGWTIEQTTHVCCGSHHLALPLARVSKMDTYTVGGRGGGGGGEGVRGVLYIFSTEQFWCHFGLRKSAKHLFQCPTSWHTA